jgi:hypothetical protein
LEQRLEGRRSAQLGEEWKPVRRGWCLGSATFRGKLLDLMDHPAGAHHFGEEVREAEEARGRRIIRAGLAKAKWDAGRLEASKKAHSVKVAMAMQLRKETTLTCQWIAQHLHMGSREYLNRLLYEARQEGIS